MIVVPSVQISWVKSIGINDKKRDRYEQEIVIVTPQKYPRIFINILLYIMGMN